MAFDYGARRIGTAVGNALTATATALEAIRNTSDGPDWKAIENLIREWQPGALVVGLPLLADGTEGDSAAAARRFGEALTDRFGLTVAFEDERHTSQVARAHLRRARAEGYGRRTRKEDVDKLSAQVILQSYFDRRPSGGH